jgi:hypothetical protein
MAYTKLISQTPRNSRTFPQRQFTAPTSSASLLPDDIAPVYHEHLNATYKLSDIYVQSREKFAEIYRLPKIQALSWEKWQDVLSRTDLDEARRTYEATKVAYRKRVNSENRIPVFFATKMQLAHVELYEVTSAYLRIKNLALLALEARQCLQLVTAHGYSPVIDS